MKKLLITIMSLFLTSMLTQAAQLKVDRVDPPYWWIGMRADTLQLMVCGAGIGDARASLDYPGVSIAETVRLDSPDYLFLYLRVTPEARPGTMDIKFQAGKKKTEVKYTLRQRDRAPEDYPGFDTTDVLYLIMPDRFARGTSSPDDATRARSLEYKTTIDRGNPNARHGGDIAGILEHLDYIDSLGVTAVWVNPVLTNDMPGGSYHGYATTDYYGIDPRFGTNEEWTSFISKCHDRGIKVVMDMIFNHSGSNHPWMKNPPSKDWFNFPDTFTVTNHRLSTVFDPYASEYDKRRTVDGWFVESMPDLNQRNPHLMKYLIQNSIWWIESSKIDGIRMDTHPYADKDGMASWIAAVEKEYPRFNIVGECWYNNEGGEAYWQRGSYVNKGTDSNLPTVMDFIIATKGREAFTEETDPWNNGLHKIYNHLALDYLFPDPSKILTFLDNHDTDRFLLEQPADLGSWKQAITFLLTSRGIPQIYYGTELLMNGTKEKSDGYVRLDMPGGFPGDTVNAFTPQGRTPMQNEAHDFMARLLHWRRGNDVIAHGTLKHFIPQTGVYIYERRLGDKQVVVMLNGTDTPVKMEMDRTLEIMPYGTRFHDVITGSEVTIEPVMTFTPRQVLVLER